MGGKYGMGGMYPSYAHGGEHDPPQVKTVGNNIDFSGDDTVKSTRTYTEGPTTGGFTDFAPIPAYRRAFARVGGEGQTVSQGGSKDKTQKEISATEALLNRLNEGKLETRIVDDEGNEITNEDDWNKFERKKRRDLQIAREKGEIDIKTYQKEVELLDGTAIAFPEYMQSQGKNQATRNLYGSVAREKDPQAHVNETLGRESHWFDKNDPKFGAGGFDVSNPGHVIEYQMMYNQLAAPGKEIKVDGKWGEQTDSATVPIRESEKEELGGGVDPDLEMRLYEEKPTGGWDQEESGGGRPGGGGGGGYTPGRVRRGGGGGGNLFGVCKPGQPCAAHLEDGGIMKTRFKDGGVYYMR